MEEKGKSSVYAIRNNANGKLYIGTSSDLDARIAKHVYLLENRCHPVKTMQRDFDESGGNFSVATLFDGSESDAVLALEKLYMTVLETRNEDIGYNYNDQSAEFDMGAVSFRQMGKRYRNGHIVRDSAREWLITAREAAGLKQEDVASLLGMSASYYSFIENGMRQKKMDLTLAVKLSGILGIPIERIVELESDEPHPG